MEADVIPTRPEWMQTLRISAFAGMSAGGVPACAVRTVTPSFAGMTGAEPDERHEDSDRERLPKPEFRKTA